MAFTDEALLELIERIYAATTDPAEFHAFLDRISAFLRSPVSTLILRDRRNSMVDVASAVGLASEYRELYEEYFYQRNVWFPGGQPVEYNVARNGSSILPEDKLVRSEYYNDYLRPQDLFHMVGMAVRPDEHQALSFSALRGRGLGEFSARELRALQVLVPHLQRAIGIRKRIERAELLKSASCQALDNQGIGMALLDRQGRIRSINHELERIVGLNDGIRAQNGRLKLSDSKNDRQLMDLVESCFGRVSSARGRGGSLSVHRRSFQMDFFVVIDPVLVPNLIRGFSLAAVYVRDPENHQVSRISLQQVFGLTNAEARLASLLAEGRSLGEIGESQQVTQNTVRSQLKSVFQKTGARRQGELISLVLRSFPIGSNQSEKE